MVITFASKSCTAPHVSSVQPILLNSFSDLEATVLIITPANLHSIDSPCPGSDFEYRLARVKSKTVASRSEKAGGVVQNSHDGLRRISTQRL